MGISTNAHICYGILFEEDFEFPWEQEKYLDGDLEEWWLKINNYKSPFELFDEHGGYLNGKNPTDTELTTWYDHKKNFLEQKKIPIELVNCCSGNYPIYIVAIPSTVLTASRGYPITVVLSNLIFSTQERQALIDFCVIYCGMTREYCEESVKWYLASYTDL